MKNRKGFTLIELLVVVLIIGILAAIALPQYKMSVERTRMSQAFVTGKAIEDSFVRYLASGPAPDSVGFDVLDIDLGPVDLDNTRLIMPFFTYRMNCSVGHCSLWGYRHNGDECLYSFEIMRGRGYSYSNRKGCSTENNDMGRKLCKYAEQYGFEFWEYPDCWLE